ncbi:MAG: DUF2817 domain-containing protein [Planctomycetes bacterium]|nr:DUF2817 domain-containing protein [Planctomycetota bacterium]
MESGIMVTFRRGWLAKMNKSAGGSPNCYLPGGEALKHTPKFRRNAASLECATEYVRRLPRLAAILPVLLLALAAGAGCDRPFDQWFRPPGKPVEPVAQTQPELEYEPPIATRPAAEPFERIVNLGKSARGRQIEMYEFGRKSLPAVLIIGGVHGDEPQGAEVAAKLVEYIRLNRAEFADAHVVIIPCLNPDGRAAGTRGNFNGVDLNRNMPADNWEKTTGRYNGGKNPSSEPETGLLISAIESVKPALTISIHAIAGGKQCNNWDGPAERTARAMAKFNGYPPKATIGYPTPGSLGSWAGKDRSMAVITLEMPSALTAEKCWEQNRQALISAIKGR